MTCWFATRIAPAACTTDESKLYPALGTEFAKHETVNQAAKEYARCKGDDLVTTNSIEGFFGVFKRGFRGIYQHCGEAALAALPQRVRIRHNNRSKLGVEDDERALIVLCGMEGKRLTYRRIGGAGNAQAVGEGVFEVKAQALTAGSTVIIPIRTQISLF